MERINIPKILDIIKEAKAGTIQKPAWYFMGQGRVILVCQCGETMMLNHEISEDGTVSPSIWHDVPECGWHIYGKLNDYDKQAVK